MKKIRYFLNINFCWNQGKKFIAMEKKNYNKKSSTKSIPEIFNECYGKLQNTKENAQTFKEGLLEIIKSFKG